ncbi:MAG: PRC-barrel domain-containing protein [Candidatus Hadarchaeales archaeon]
MGESLGQVLASRLRGMTVVTDRGLNLGKLSDLIMDENTGAILSLVVKPAEKGLLDNLPKDDRGLPVIAYSSVIAIKELIVVNERVLAIHQMKASGAGVSLPSAPAPAEATTVTTAPPAGTGQTGSAGQASS